jgi:hypothetical protein
MTCAGAEPRSFMLHRGLASFDKLRMRSFLCGMIDVPFSIFVILSLSKDTRVVLQRPMRFHFRGVARDRAIKESTA